MEAGTHAGHEIETGHLVRERERERETDRDRVEKGGKEDLFVVCALWNFFFLHKNLLLAAARVGDRRSILSQSLCKKTSRKQSIAEART